MIRIKKPTKAPPVLQNRGIEATHQLCAEYDRDPTAGTRWSFDSRVYAAKSVKDALRKAQHDKCAFCESKVTHVAYGDVEHFRPKAAYRQTPDDTLAQPGYYWLAYDWNNLLFCCEICNRRHKSNHFPLIDNSRRAKSHHDDITNEEPLFIHPADENPDDFVAFREEYLYATKGNPRGTITIDVLGLNRELIAERRRDLLATMKALIGLRERYESLVATHSSPTLRTEIAEINAQLERLSSDSAEYAAMVRALQKQPARTST